MTVIITTVTDVVSQLCITNNQTEEIINGNDNYDNTSKWLY